MRLRPSPAAVISVGALVTAMSGTAVAATGSPFVLGHSNKARATTTLSNSGGIALSLKGGKGKPAIAVNNTVKITNLNSDLLDGLDSTQLQQRVSGSCSNGQMISAVGADGTVTCTTPEMGAGSGILGSQLYTVSSSVVGDGSNTVGYVVADCRSTGDVLLSGGYVQQFQAQAKVEGSFPENYLEVTSEHTAGWAVMYQYLPANEEISSYAICETAPKQ